MKPLRKAMKSEEITPKKIVRQSLKSLKDSPMAWVIWTTVAIFYLYEYVLRVSPTVMTQQLMRDFSATATQLGVLSSFYYYAYVPLQIPCGIIVDRLGVRKVITFSALLCVLGSYLFATTTSLVGAELGRFLMGAGSACAYLSCNKVSGEWFSNNKFAVLSGMTLMMGTLGGTFGGRPFAMLVNAVGWQTAMLYATFVGFGVVALCWFVLKDSSPIQEEKKTKTKAASLPLLESLAIIVKNPQNWIIGLYGGLMYVPLSAFAELWAVPYLMELYQVGNETASTMSILFFIGIAVGCPLAGVLSNYVKSRTKVMRLAALGTIIPFLFVIHWPPASLHLMGVLLFIAGFISAGQVLFLASAKEINPVFVLGTTVGFANFLTMFTGPIFQPLLGMLLDYTWGGQYNLDGTRFYSIHSYQFALTSMLFCLVASWCLACLIKETYTEDKR